MGPYAGLVLALPAAAWGLKHSIPFDPTGPLPAGLMFGDSLLFSWLEATFSPAGSNVILHPIGMAGWVGLFITSLNLIPAAQLDGGHVAYALFGRHQVKISLLVVVGLFTLGFGINFLGATGHGGEMWILWALLLFVIGLRHPPVQDEALPLTFAEKLNGITALILFVLTFIPVPVQLTQVGDTLPEEPRLEAMPGDGDRIPVPEGSESAPKSGPDSGSRGEEFKL
jgi:membrane-associated protease RseP (regulator of RpoE activity)